MNNSHRNVLKQARNISGSTKALLNCLLGYCHGDKTECYPSIKDLCEQSGFTERTVQRNLRKLEQTNHIRTIEHNGRKSNTYILLDLLEDTGIESTPRQKRVGTPRQITPQSLPLKAEENTCSDVDLDLSVQKPSDAPLDPPNDSSTQQSKPHPDSSIEGENQKPEPESPSEGKNQESKPKPESSGPVERRKAKPFPDAPTELTVKEDLDPNDTSMFNLYATIERLRVQELKDEAEAKAKAEERARAKAPEIPPDKPVTAQNLQELNPKPKPEPKPALNGENPEPKPAKPEEKQDYTHKKLKFEGNWNSLNKIIEIWEVFSAENNEWITRSEDGFHNFLSTYAAVAKKAKLPIYHKKRVKDFYSYFVYLFKNSLDKSVIRRRDEDKAREIKKELFRKDLYPAF